MLLLKSTLRLASVAGSVVFGTSAFAFTVTNNTVVGLEGISRSLVEYDFAGNITETMALTGFSSVPVGVAVIGNRIFVSDSAGNTGEVNLTTGALFNVFSSTPAEGLGDDGTNLLVLNYTTGIVQRRTTAGTLLGSVSVAGAGAGIDGDANGFWVGMHGPSGNALRYDNAGNLQSTVTTGLAASTVSGLGWDSVSGSLWIATGYGDDRIRAFDVNGNVLANFATNRTLINGLDVVTEAVPEPTTMAILTVGGLLVARRRRKSA